MMNLVNFSMRSVNFSLIGSFFWGDQGFSEIERRARHAS
jgi:hypothetical protein